MSLFRRRIMESNSGGMPSDVNRVGGRIFYIHSDNGITYRFFDENEKEITDISVSGLANAYWYWSSATASTDKFYVYDTNGLFSGKWGQYGTTTGATANSIGSGKTNTTKILSFGVTALWSIISVIKRGQKVGGCNDWYVGSMVEQNQLRSSGLVDWYNSYEIWTSCENSSYYSYRWNSLNGSWYFYSKQNSYHAFAMRSF